MSEDSHSFTGVLAEIADAAGLPAALAIVERWGGDRLYIPSRLVDSHPLVQAVGIEAAEKIRRHLCPSRGMEIKVPISVLGRRAREKQMRARGLQMLDAGATVSQVVRACQVDRDTVNKWKRAAAASDTRQGSLF